MLLYLMTSPGGQNIWSNTYVDDLFLGCNPVPIKDMIISHICATFEMKDLGILSRPLGMELVYNKEKGTCTLHQAVLIRDLLSDRDLMGSNPRILLLDPNQKFSPQPEADTPVPMSECDYLGIVGSLLHLMN
jgi:hypothetical protein